MILGNETDAKSATDSPRGSVVEALKGYHLWAISVITVILILTYTVWPWSEWQLTGGIWQLVPWLSLLRDLAIVEVNYRFIGLLFYLPIIYAALTFSWQGALATTTLSVGSVSHILVRFWSPGNLAANVVLLLLPLLLLGVVSVELHWRRRQREYLAQREEERKIFLAKVLEAQEIERQRISQDLHDEIIQTLLAIGRSIETLIPSECHNLDAVRRQAMSVRDLAFSTVDDLRSICADLRPSILDSLGLVPALRWLGDQHNAEGALNIQVSSTGVERRLSPQTELALFRIVQEALNNIVRHSAAKNGKVSLEFTDEHLNIAIQDDGKGFYPATRLAEYSNQGKLGLIGIKQRVDLINGEFQVCSAPGEGTKLLVKVKT